MASFRNATMRKFVSLLLVILFPSLENSLFNFTLKPIRLSCLDYSPSKIEKKKRDGMGSKSINTKASVHLSLFPCLCITYSPWELVCEPISSHFSSMTYSHKTILDQLLLPKALLCRLYPNLRKLLYDL